MFEKVNPAHPDKIADRIAGAMVDLAYKKQGSPKVAIEVLIGHGACFLIGESTYQFNMKEIKDIINRIAPDINSITCKIVEQNDILASNQENKIRCGDNGIFKGMPLTKEQLNLTRLAVELYNRYPYDGKYLIKDNFYTICQSHAKDKDLTLLLIKTLDDIIQGRTCFINPLGYWTGGLNVDAGATNRKLGSDMGDSITGGGLHGKDLSKADVSLNIYAFLKAQKLQKSVELSCSIGDEMVDGRPYSEIVEIAKAYIDLIGGFEKFAEWGLINLMVLK